MVQILGVGLVNIIYKDFVGYYSACQGRSTWESYEAPGGIKKNCSLHRQWAIFCKQVRVRTSQSLYIRISQIFKPFYNYVSQVSSQFSLGISVNFIFVEFGRLWLGQVHFGWIRSGQGRCLVCSKRMWQTSKQTHTKKKKHDDMLSCNEKCFKSSCSWSRLSSWFHASSENRLGPNI